MVLTPPRSIIAISEVLKVWLPFVTVTSVLFAAYRSTKKSITTWANKLMNNHLDHIQKSLEKIDSAQQQQLDHLSVQSENLTAQTVLLNQIAIDLRPAPALTLRAPKKRGKITNRS